MKRFISLFLCLMLFATALPLNALADAGRAASDSSGLSVDILSEEEMQQKSLGQLYEGTEAGAAVPVGESVEEVPEPTEAPTEPAPESEPEPEPEPETTEEPETTPEPTEAPLCTLTEGCTLPEGHEDECLSAMLTPSPEPVLMTEIVLSLPEEGAVLMVGGTLQLAAEILPAEAAQTMLLWTSSDESIAAVDETGLVTTLMAGVVTITAAATDGSGVSAQIELTVAEAPAGLSEGNWLYRIDETTGYAIITGYLDAGAKVLNLPDTLGGAFVAGIDAGALSTVTALTNVYAHGNIGVIGQNAFPAGTTLHAYHGAYALTYAQENGLTANDLSEFYFVDGVVDYTDIAKGRYAFAGDTTVRMRPLEASRLAEGSVFYLPASSKYPNGEGFVVESVKSGSDWVTLHCRVARGEEIISRIVIERQTLTPDWENAIWADGVTLVEDTEGVDGMSALATGMQEPQHLFAASGTGMGAERLADVEAKLSTSQKLEISKKIGKVKLSGSVELKVFTNIEADIKVFKGKIDEFSVVTGISGKAAVGFSAKSGNFEDINWGNLHKFGNYGSIRRDSIKLVKLPLTGSSLASVYVEIGLKYEFSGEAKLTFEFKTEAGKKWNSATQRLEDIKSTKATGPEFVLEGKVKAGIYAAVGVEVLFLGDVLEFSLWFGVKVEAEWKSSAPTCIDLKFALFAEVAVSSELKLIAKVLGKVKYELEIALPKSSGHYELGSGRISKADDCTYGDKEKWTVKFVTHTNQILDDQQITDGQSANEPTLKTPDNASFVRWYYIKNGSKVTWNFSNKVTGNMVLYAEWSYEEMGSDIISGGGSSGSDVNPEESYNGPLTYESIGTSWEITGTTEENPTHVSIPAYIDDYPVTSIGVGAFEDCTTLTSVDIPEGIIAVKRDAFRNCANLKSIDIPDSVVEIGDSAFYRCTSLESIDLSDNLATMGSHVFGYCENLAAIELPESLREWDWSVFYRCTKIETLVIPDGITILPNGLVGECTSLKSITIPDSVTRFESSPFRGCSSLESIYIPDGVKAIEDYAFGDCKSLISIDIPNSVTSIGRGAFNGCSGLTSISIPDSVTSIGAYAFDDCQGLVSVRLPSNIDMPDTDYMFAGCTNLLSVDIPDSVTSIGERMFGYCEKLTSIAISDNLISIGREAFMGCQELKVINIPDSVDYVGEYAFSGCINLRSIEIPSNASMPSTYCMFDGCGTLTSVVLPTGTTSIDDFAFANCYNLSTISIPEGVEKIGRDAFFNCEKLDIISIPDSVTSIDSSAFGYRRDITIRANRGSYAHTYALENNITFQPIGVTSYILRFVTNSETTYSVKSLVPGAFIPYPAVPVRNGYTFTGWYSDRGCTTLWDFSKDVMPENNLTLYAGWRIADEDMSFSGITELMTLGEGNETEGVTFTAYTGDLSHFVIPNCVGATTVTAIGSKAFVDSDPYKITIPASIAEIADGAFGATWNLGAFVLEEGNTEFQLTDGVLLSADGTRLLRYPPAKLGASYNVPEGVKSIDAYAFYGAKNLKTISLPEGLTNVGDSAFAFCDALETLTFPTGVENLGISLFSNCDYDLRLYGPVEDCAIKSYAETNRLDYNLYPVSYFNGMEEIHTRKVRAGDLLPEMQTPEHETNELCFAAWCKDIELTSDWDMATDIMPTEPLSLYLKWGSEFNYTGTDSLTITGYDGTDSFITVPESIFDVPVTGIAEGAFVSKTDAILYELVVPSCVTEIAAGAIQGTEEDLLVVIADEGSAAANYVANYGTIYHVASDVKEYPVTYEPNGGRSVPGTEIVPGAAVPLPETVRDNYTFAGWYIDSTLETAWMNGDIMPAAPLTLYAKWTILDASITDTSFLYTAKNGAVTIHAYTGRSNFVTIPEAINGEPVTEISDFFLQDDTLVQRLTIPESVARVGSNAFQNSVLYSVTFEGVGALALGDSVFANCPYLTELNFGNRRVELISDNLFAHCTGLRELNLPAGVTTIEEASFYGCNNLLSLTLPETLMSVGESAFAECVHLCSLRFMGALPTGIDADALYHTQADLVLLYEAGAIGWTMPELVVTEEDGSETRFRTASIGAEGAYISRLAVNRRNAAIGETLMWTLSVEGEGEWNYRYTLYLDGQEEALMTTGWLSTSSYSYTVENAGEYRMEVVAKNDNGVTTAPQSCTVVVTKRVIPVKELWLNNAMQTLNVEDTSQLEVTLTPENATDPTLVWSSSNPLVATVDEMGLVTAKGMGSATITASASNGLSASCHVVVTTIIPPSLAILPPEEDFFYDSAVQLETDCLNFETPPKIIWKSETTDIATVDASGILHGIVPGMAIIRATAADDDGVSAVQEITVKPVLAASISVTTPEFCAVGRTVTPSAKMLPVNAWNKNVTWTIERGSECAAINAETGELLGIAEGEVVVRATAQDGSGVYAEKTIQVVDWQIAVDGSGVTELTSGKTLQLKAAYVPPELTAGAFVWSIPEEFAAYASVSSTGLVTAKTVESTQTIEVLVRSTEDGPAAGSYTLKILPKATGLEVYRDIDVVGATGAAVQTLAVDMYHIPNLYLSAVTQPADAVDDVTWKTSASSVATVNENGLVTFVKPGTVTIIAEAADGSGKTASVKFSVIYLDAATRFTATSDAPAIGLQAGDTAQISVFGTDKANALSKTEFSYSIPAAQAEIASVDESGVVTGGSKPGTATVTAELKGDPLKRKATVNVKVIPTQTARVTLTTDEMAAPAPAEIVWLDANGNVTTETGEIHSYVVNLDVSDMAAHGLTKSGYAFTITPALENADGNEIPLTGKSVKYATTDGKIATVKLNADGAATVTVKGNAQGACTITATTTDLAKVEGHLSIYVRDYAPRLGSNKLTVNPKQSSGTVTALTGSYGNAVQSVTLHEYNGTGYAETESTRFTADYDSTKQHLTLKATGELTNQTVKARLNVVCADKPYPMDITITVKNAEPAITVKQSGKFNLFYFDSETTLTVTAKDAAITGLALTGTADFTGTDNGDGTLTVRYADSYTGGTANAKGTLLVTVAGYEKPIGKAITIGTAKTKPKLTTSPASSVINTARADKGAAFTVYNTTAKENVTLDEVRGTINFGSYSVNSEKDTITLTLQQQPNGNYIGGSAALTVREANWTEGIAITHKVTVQNKPATAKLGASTLKLNNRFTDRTAETTLTLNQANETIDAEKTLIENITAAKLYAEGEKILASYADGVVSAEFTAPAAKGTYSYRITPVLTSGETLKPVTVKVSVAETEPKVTAATGTLKLNTQLAGEEEAYTLLKLSEKTGYTVADFAELPMTKDGVTLRYADGKLYAKLTGEGAAKTTFELTPIVKDDTTEQIVTLGTKLKLTVRRYSNAAMSATAAAKGSLDAGQRNNSSIVYTITKLTNAAGEIEGITLTGKDAGKFELVTLEADATGRARVELRLKADESYATKATYTIQLAVHLKGVSAPILTKELRVKVKQTALKLTLTAIQANAYQSQDGMAVVEYELRLTGPADGRIAKLELDSVKTLLALRRALGVNGEIETEFAPDGKSAKVRVRLKDTSKVTVGKSYTFLVNVYAEGQAEDVNPVQVKLTMKVAR